MGSAATGNNRPQAVTHHRKMHARKQSSTARSKLARGSHSYGNYAYQIVRLREGESMHKLALLLTIYAMSATAADFRALDNGQSCASAREWEMARGSTPKQGSVGP